MKKKRLNIEKSFLGVAMKKIFFTLMVFCMLLSAGNAFADDDLIGARPEVHNFEGTNPFDGGDTDGRRVHKAKGSFFGDVDAAYTISFDNTFAYEGSKSMRIIYSNVGGSYPSFRFWTNNTDFGSPPAAGADLSQSLFVDYSDYDTLSFWVRTDGYQPTNGIMVDFNSQGGGNQKTFNIPAAAATSWQKVSISLAGVTGLNQFYNMLFFIAPNENTGGVRTLYIDNLQFEKSGLSNPTVASVVKPEPGTTHRVSWPLVAGSTLYEIWFDDNTDLSNAYEDNGPAWAAGTWGGAWPNGGNVHADNPTVAYEDIANRNDGDWYKIRYRDASGAWSPWSTSLQLGGVNLVAPTIADIDDSDRNGKYEVDWSDVPGAAFYHLQEATDSSFTQNVVNGYPSSSFETFTHNDTANTTYYYRVRSFSGEPSEGGAAGPWSTTKYLSLGDEFRTPTSGDIFPTDTWEPKSGVWVNLYQGTADGTGTFRQDAQTASPYNLSLVLGEWYYIRAETEGYTFPSETVETWNDGIDHGYVFQATTTELTVDIPMDPGYPIEVDKKVSKNKVTIGDIITVSVEVENKGRWIHDNVLLRDTIPAGFKLVEDSVQLTGSGTLNSVTNDGTEYTFDIDGVPGFGSVTVSYQMIVGSGVPTGKRHDTKTYAWHGVRNWRLALDDETMFLVEEDPLFDRGLVIGKVFNDMNKNGYQDKGEMGLGGIKLATEQGIVIYTDKYGRYSIPALSEGRHLVKVDKASLPADSEIISEETYLFSTTPGLTSKVNFAVYAPNYSLSKYNESMDVLVQEVFAKAKANLSVYTEESNYEINSTGSLVGDKGIKFFLNSNYAGLIKNWEILVFDQDGENISYLSGEAPMVSEFKWDGKDSDTGEMVIEADKTYYYILKVSDAEENMSSTSYNRFTTKGKSSTGLKTAPIAKPALDSEEELMDDISISDYSAIQLSGEVDKSEELYINGRKVQVQDNGEFVESLVVPYGKNYITLTKKDKDGRSVSYIKEVDVKENYMFMVGLAEGEMTDMNLNGNVEAIGDSDNRWRDEFFTQGKVAYYLKAKVKGKYIITSSLDSDRQRKELFTNLDPEKYYPVYGDDSTVNYDAHDTQGAFYVLLEVDDSFAKWGNYETAFNDTVFGQYNRSLYGGKVHVQSVEKTQFNTPKYKISAFSADINQLASRDELLATGGSLYYLRNQDVIEGSEKVTVEVRDKFSGLVMQTIKLSAGDDYRIDYDQGRIILDKPLSMITRSKSIISNDILNGHNNYLMVDYEYENQDDFSKTGSKGIRAVKTMGDNIELGGTYIREDKDTSNYRLEGIDTVIHMGKKTTLKVEYNSSHSENTKSYYSPDGGLSYQDISPSADDDRNSATAVTFESDPTDNLRVGAYYQNVDAGFSSSGTATEEGLEKIGAEISYNLFDSHIVNLKHDHKEVIKEDDNFDEIEGYTRQEITTLQMRSQVGKFEFIEELQHREQKTQQFYGKTIKEDLLAAQAMYNFTDNFSAYVGQQIAVNSTDDVQSNDQTIVGFNTSLLDGKLNVSLEERIGSRGDSTILGIGADMSDKISVYTNLSTTDTYDKGRRYDSTFGSVTELDDDYRVYTEEKISSYENGNSYGTLLGVDKRLSDYLSVNANFERSNVDERFYSFERNTIAVGATYYEKDFLKLGTKWEFRKDRGSENIEQVFTANNIKWDVSESIEVSYKLDYSKAKNKTTSSEVATYWKTGVGFAYRPVDHDWLNIISKYVFLDDAYPFDYNDSDITYERELASIASTEFIMDLGQYFELVEKFALKNNKVLYMNSYTDSETYLWVNRLNYHLMKKWDIGLEYRILRQDTVKDQKEGFLLEVNRRLGDTLNVGVGYNFTEFTDDLENRNDYDAKGWFIRLSAQY